VILVVHLVHVLILVNDIHHPIEIVDDQLKLKKNIHQNIEGKTNRKKKQNFLLNFDSLNRSPPRPSRDHERRRSPRPPPTVQQSTQRTIVYMQESSHSR
jgi:hypothetical protein